MTARHLEVRRGAYRDSVRLMQVSRALTGVPGVSGALVAMATDLNLELLAGLGFAAPDGAGPNDMVVAVAAESDSGIAAALDRLEAELAGPGPGSSRSPAASPTAAEAPPRTVGSAVRRHGATLALVSTPGPYAFVEAVDALEAGASVLVFSDNVPVEQEVALKDLAARRGLLVMGPDCGTAVVGGVGLGFANVVRPGPIGLVAASGTGAQQVMALLDAAGAGISHCLGVGGRDLSAAIGGRSTLAALDALDADPETRLIMVISKPPDAAVADRVRAHAAGLGTPVRFALLGAGQPDLAEATAGALRALDTAPPPTWPSWLPSDAPTARQEGSPLGTERQEGSPLGTGRQEGSPVGAGPQEGSPVGTPPREQGTPPPAHPRTGEPFSNTTPQESSPVGAGRQEGSPLGVGRQEGSPVGTPPREQGTPPPAHPRTGEPFSNTTPQEGSPVGAGREEGSPLGTGRQEGSPVGAGREEGSPLGTGRQEGSPVGTPPREQGTPLHVQGSTGQPFARQAAPSNTRPDAPADTRSDAPADRRPDAFTGVRGALRGLFSGGTLCDEAMVIASVALGPIASNIPLRPEWALQARGRAVGHVMIDFGDDAYTRGRPHPMIDNGLRLDRLAAEAADPTCGVILLDVVLGHGAHPDPAGDLAPAVADAVAGGGPAVVITLVGTGDDPQGLDRQAAALCAAGAAVFRANADAVRYAVGLLGQAPAQQTTQQPEQHRTRQPAQQTTQQPEQHRTRQTAQQTTQQPGRHSTTHQPEHQPELLSGEPAVAAVGVDLFVDALAAQAASPARVAWTPPPAADVLARVFADSRRAGANAEAVRRMLAAGAALVDVRPAGEVLGLAPGQFCHAGPPITWDRASGPMRGALVGAMLLEGLADDPADAERQLAGGGVDLTPCHSLGGVGPMAGVVSPSMWVFVLRDEAHDRTSWCTLNEGLGKVLRYGAYAPEVIGRLRWMSAVLGPALRAAVRAHGPVDVKALIGQMVQMGDEGHNRNRAGTLMLLRDLLPHLVEADTGLPAAEVARVARFVGGNDHFFLNLVMPAGKLQTAAAAGIPGATLVTAMARNGTDFGIQVAGTGDAWFTGPAAVPEGLFLGAYGPDDANPDIGDSAITETAGLGGFAMAGAPAIVRFVGGTVPDALRTTAEMYEITLAENPAYALPVLDFRGTPTGIDVTRVVRTGLLPQINTGIAGRIAGTGQVGAGLVRPPAGCFTAALEALADAVPR